MIIHEIFLKYRNENEFFELIPIGGINYLNPISASLRKQIEIESFDNEFYISSILNSNKDKLFIFQLLSMVDDFPSIFFNNIMNTLLQCGDFFHKANFHVKRIYGFIKVEKWFQEEFTNSYSYLAKINILKIWKNNRYDDLVDILNDKIIVESKSKYSWKLLSYKNSNEIIQDKDYELELNLTMQNRYNLVLNTLNSSKVQLDLLHASIEILPIYSELNEINKNLLKSFTAKLKSLENKELNFWLDIYEKYL